MFKNPTVIILGAGASCHLGYPTGEQLVTADGTNSIISNINRGELLFFGPPNTPGINSTANECIKLLQKYDYIENTSEVAPYNIRLDGSPASYHIALKEIPKVQRFVSALKEYRPTNIDLFLKYHPEFRTVGKDMIAGRILACENEAHIQGGGVKDNWYNYLVEAIIKGCDTPEDIHKNKLTIVTFNYDISLEAFLYKRLKGVSFFKDEIDKFLESLEIIHIYGQLGLPKWQKNCYGNDFAVPERTFEYQASSINTLQTIRSVAEGIQVIGESKQQDFKNATHVKLARKHISDAVNIFIFGYAFDPDNSNLLFYMGNENQKRHILSKQYTYDSDEQTASRGLFYTNYGDSLRVSRRCASSFFNNEAIVNDIHQSNFLQRNLGSYKFSNTSNSRPITVIKSEKSVYYALSNDFDLV